MHFYRRVQGKKLHAFGEAIGAVPIYNTPLSEIQRNTIERLGCELIDVGSESEITDEKYFLFDEDLYFTQTFVRTVLNIARQNENSQRFCLEDNTFNQRYVLPDSPDEKEYLKFNFFYKNKSQPNVVDTTIPQVIFEHKIRLPRQIVQQGEYHYDQSETFIGRMASPFHLLQLNLAHNVARTVKLRGWLSKKVAEKLAPIGSPRYHKALRSLNKIGKNCKIHKTAVIEGSEIGDNVTIGANAIVRLSQVGSGTTISDNATVTVSLIGEGNFIACNHHINLCMTYENVFLIHGPYQFSIYGRNVAAMAVINCDMRLDQKNISIPTDRGLVDSRQALLGIAYGHDSVVGGGNIIAPGRIVPNGTKILPPDTILTGF